MNDIPALLSTDPSAAVDEIYRRHGTDMLSVAVGIMRRWADAEDAVQAALVSVWTYAGTYRPSGDIEPWLMRIVRSKCHDIIRRRSRKGRDREILTDFSQRDVTDDVNECDDLAEYVPTLPAKVAGLSPRSREILSARLSGLEDSEIGRQFGVGRSTAWRWRLEAELELAGTIV